MGGGQPTSSGGNSAEGGSSDNCEYPAGPYGVELGDILSPELAWQGLIPHADSIRTIRADNFFDCDGSLGIHALLIDTSQYG